MAGITVTTIIPRIAPQLKAVLREAASDAANVTAQNIKSKGRAMIRGSYKNMGGLANAFRVTVLPKNKKATTPALIASVSTSAKSGQKDEYTQGYTKVFEKSASSEVRRPITGRMWIPFPDAKKLMGRKRITPKQWGRKLKFATFGDTVVALANIGFKTQTPRKFRSAKAPRLIKRAKKTDAENWVPMWYLATQVDIAPQWELRSLIKREWQSFGSNYRVEVRKKWDS